MDDFFKRVKGIFRIFNNYVITNSKLIIRNVIIVLLLAVVVLVAVSMLVFIFVRKGPPEVSVPKVTGNDLIEGLLILQKKKLNSVIDPRYFSDQEKNIIVEQDPKPGSSVREGKSIKLVVSKGPIISIVEDYTGETVAFVQNRLQEIFSFQSKTIKIGTVATIASAEPAGTIIGQSPPPNTPITNVETIDLVVSKGPEIQAFYLDNYTDQNIKEVMQALALRGVLVNIIPEDTSDPVQNGIIIAQEPPEGTVVKRNETVTFYVGYLPSEKGKDKLYARVLNFDVPKDLNKVQVRIVVKDKISEREIYNDENSGGDSLSIPFKSYSNTTVYIYIDEGVYEVRKIE